MRPIADDAERCGAYWLEGRQIAAEEVPMLAVLKTGIPILGVEGLVERRRMPNLDDGSHRTDQRRKWKNRRRHQLFPRDDRASSRDRDPRGPVPKCNHG